MRYDVEVSGFPSSHSGHLCLFRLKEDDYPGTTRIEEWPSWDLPVLKWGKSQGGVVGFSHSGWGLKTSDDKLPTYDVPPFDGIGANEYIVDVVHDAVDFISTVDTPAPGSSTSGITRSIADTVPRSAARPIFPASTAKKSVWAESTSSSPRASSTSTSGAKA